MKYLRVFHWVLVKEKTDEYAPVFRTPSEAGEYLSKLPLAEESRERFLVASLNTRNAVITIDEISIGTVNGSLVHPREVFRCAVAANAAGVVLVHNHPSGDPTPSKEDSLLTTRIKQAGNILGIEVLDHIVVTPSGDFYSFQDHGLM